MVPDPMELGEDKTKHTPPGVACESVFWGLGGRCRVSGVRMPPGWIQISLRLEKQVWGLHIQTSFSGDPSILHDRQKGAPTVSENSCKGLMHKIYW